MSAAVVTGAGRGLGLEIARALAARGLAVNVTDVDAEAAGPRRGRARRRRLGDGARRPRPGRLPRGSRRPPSEPAALDVWVNNAGVLATGPSGTTTKRCVGVFEVNTLGTINGTLAALERCARPIAAT